MATDLQIEVLERVFEQGNNPVAIETFNLIVEAKPDKNGQSLVDKFYAALQSPQARAPLATWAADVIKHIEKSGRDREKYLPDDDLRKLAKFSAAPDAKEKILKSANSTPAPAPAPAGGPSASTAASANASASASTASAASTPPGGGAANAAPNPAAATSSASAATPAPNPPTPAAAQPQPQPQAQAGNPVNAAKAPSFLKKTWGSLTAQFKLYGVPSSVTRAAPQTGADQGIALPEYIQGINWYSHFLKRSWKPWKLFTHWTPNIQSAATDPTPILKSVIAAADENMQTHGLVEAIQKLQVKMQFLSKRLKDNPNDRDNILVDVNSEISQFSTNNLLNLQRFSSDLDILIDHVESTYTPLSKNDGRYVGLVHFELEGEVKISHLNALLSYLRDMRNMATEMQKPDFGREGVRLKALTSITDDNLLADEISNNLNKITEVVKGSHMRLHPKGTSAQAREALIRCLAEGYYNPYSRKNKPAETNIEALWQGLEERYFKYADENGVVSKWDVQTTRKFATELKQIYDAGFEQEAIYTIRMLRSRRGDAHNETYDSGFIDVLKEPTKNYGKDPHYTAWVEKMATAADLSWVTGARLHTFDPGREAEKFFTEKSYTPRFFFRHRSTSLLAKPGLITILREGIVHPIIKNGSWLLGAKGVVPSNSKDAKGNENAHTRWIKIKPVWGWESKLQNPLSRSLPRIFSGGLIDNLQTIPIVSSSVKSIPVVGGILSSIPLWANPTTLGKIAILSGALWAGGQGYNHLTNDGDPTILGTTVLTNIGATGTWATLGIADGISHATWGLTVAAADLIAHKGFKSTLVEDWVPTGHITAARNALFPEILSDDPYENYTPPTAEPVPAIEEAPPARESSPPSEPEKSSPSSTPEEAAPEDCRAIENPNAQMECDIERLRKKRALETSYIPHTPTAEAFAHVVHSPAHIDYAFNGVAISRGKATELNIWRIYGDNAKRHAAPDSEIA